MTASKKEQWTTVICPTCNHDVTTNAPETLLKKINSALARERKEAREAALRDAAQKLRKKAEDYRAQGERWQQNAKSAGMEIIREQDYADRDACFYKMAALTTLAIEFDEAAANTSEGD